MSIVKENKILTAIGLMSGTSLDGIDVSLIKSDGDNILDKSLNFYLPYSSDEKERIKKLINNEFDSLEYIKETEIILTKKNIEATNLFIKKYDLNNKEIDVIGYHGQTIIHNPKKLITWQIGEPQLLASTLGINVVADFRKKDIMYGGQGAPLTPIYHYKLFQNYSKKPILILNIGGVANMTYLSAENEDDMIAGDICFGNAPMNDLVKDRIDEEYDVDGNIAKNGDIIYEISNKILSDDFFKQINTKSLDRDYFKKTIHDSFYNKEISLEDSLMTMCYIIAKSLDLSILNLPIKPREIVICGGGRNNKNLFDLIAKVTKIKTVNIDDLNLDGNFIESQAFAFLAIRTLKNLPIAFKRTTGVLLEKHNAQTLEQRCLSSCGGVFYHA